jgi:pimeloyl-ACP methyl ester carboxylesterase
MTIGLTWQDAAGESQDWYQRDWVWRGWQTRYTYLRAAAPSSNPSPQSLEPFLAPPLPLLLLHGFGTSLGHWRYNLPVWAEQHSVYALDLIGFGASEKPATTYQVQLWSEQVYDFWQTFIRRPLVLVGNSIGSLVCVALVAAHPEMVAGFACLSLPDTSIREEMIPAPVRPLVFGLESLFTNAWCLQGLFYWLRRPQVVRPWARIAYANAQAVDDQLVEILTTPAQDRGAAQAFAKIIKAMTSPGFGPKVKQVFPELKIPLLLLWGQQDRMVPPMLGRKFAGYNPLVKLIELEHAGHCPHDEQPEQVNALILDWLTQVVIPYHQAGVPQALSQSSPLGSAQKHPLLTSNR